MRNSWLALTAALLAGAPLLAQPPAQAPPLAANNRLDQLLMNWEHQMQGVKTVAAHCVRTTVNQVFQVTDVYEGTASFMKPNLAMVKLTKKNKPDTYEMYVYNGNSLWEYSPQNRVVRVHDLTPSQVPAGVPVAQENSFLALLAGMQAADAKRRFDLTLVKEDQWYVYIKIIPRLPSDKADFQEARLVLNQQTYLPRELWFKEPNGNEVKWDIPRVDSGVPLNVAEFVNPQVPPGWKVQKMPRAAEAAPPGNVRPRVIRPNQ